MNIGVWCKDEKKIFLFFSISYVTRATGTWQMVNRDGIVAAISKRLSSPGNADVAVALDELELSDYSFESVRSAFPDAFRLAA